MNDKKITRREAIKNSQHECGGWHTGKHATMDSRLSRKEELVLFTDMPEDYSRPPVRPRAFALVRHKNDLRLLYRQSGLLCCARLRPTRDRSLRLHP